MDTETKEYNPDYRLQNQKMKKHDILELNARKFVYIFVYFLATIVKTGKREKRRYTMWLCVNNQENKNC